MNISEHVDFVHLTAFLGNVNHAISVVWYWLFDSNYKRLLVLNRKSFDIFCAACVGKEQVAKFELLFIAVRHICLDARLKKE